jgi:hypothetical protein
MGACEPLTPHPGEVVSTMSSHELIVGSLSCSPI